MNEIDFPAPRSRALSTVDLSRRLRKLRTDVCHEAADVIDRMSRDWWDVRNIPLTIRGCNALDNCEVRTIGQLCGLTEIELRRLPNIGNTTVHEIQAELARGHLSLAMTSEAGAVQMQELVRTIAREVRYLHDRVKQYDPTHGS